MTQYYESNFKQEDARLEKALGPILFRDQEHVASTPRLDDCLDKFIENKIGEYFNITVVDFLKLSRLEVDALCEKAASFIVKTDGIKNKIAKKMEKGEL